MPMEANSQKNQQKHRIKLFERIVFYLPRLFSISTQKNTFRLLEPYFHNLIIYHLR